MVRQDRRQSCGRLLFGLFDGEDTVCGYIVHHLASAAGPDDFYFFDERIGAKSKMNSRIARASVSNSGSDFIPLSAAVCCCQADIRADSHSVAARSNEVKQDPVIPGVRDVAKIFT